MIHIMKRDIVSILSKREPTSVSKPLVRPFHGSVEFRQNWKITGTHLVSNTPKVEVQEPVKVAAFDLDGTLINTKSGHTFARGSDDWVLFNDKVVPKLKKEIESGFLPVIFTNQGAVFVLQADSKSYSNFKGRVNQVVSQISKDIDSFQPFVFASPGMPRGKKAQGKKSPEHLHLSMRKPHIGMWTELTRVLNKEIDYDASFYVGDAAGRDTDFSDSDKAFAENVKIQFLTPEEYFV